MTEYELALYKKCTQRYRKKKKISAALYNEQHEYDIGANEENDYER